MYNEEKIIENTINTVKAYAEKNFKQNHTMNSKDCYEIILIDDGSKDSTLEKASKYVNGTTIKIISYKTNMGKGYAVRQGIFAAKKDYILFTDSDLAYGVEVFSECIKVFKKNPNADVVIGSRTLHKDGYASYTFMRKILSKAFLFFLRFIGGLKTSDSQTGFKGFKNSTAKKIFSLCEENRWSFDFEVLMIAQKLKLEIKEMPIKIISHRESKMNVLKDSIRMFSDIMKIKTRIKKMK